MFAELFVCIFIRLLRVDDLQIQPVEFRQGEDGGGPRSWLPIGLALVHTIGGKTYIVSVEGSEGHLCRLWFESQCNCAIGDYLTPTDRALYTGGRYASAIRQMDSDISGPEVGQCIVAQSS